jgi:general secretion pathway protein J
VSMRSPRHRDSISGVVRGFTLMEMLVTLVLISFATMLMFQMLGSYRVANDRVRGQAGSIDRHALFQEWFRDSVHGLYAAPNLHFVGDPAQFSATTLNPLYATEGSPTPIEWSLRAGEDGSAEIVYTEEGREQWRLPLQGRGEVEFAYFDAEWRETDTWPPKLGKVHPEGLPAVVGLVRRFAEGDRPLLVAVLGPLEPPTRLYGDEQLQ